MRVFIADDSEIYRLSLMSKLSKIKGIDITGQAKNWAEVIETIEGLTPDVAILDVRMPFGDAKSAIPIIKSNPSPPKIIMFTNYSYPQCRTMCLEAGADYFFDKSANYHELIDTLAHLGQEKNQAELAK